MKRYHFLLIFILLVTIESCKNALTNNKIIIRDTSITKITSFNTLFFDSIQVTTFLLLHPELSTYENQFNDFYKARNYQYAWFDKDGITDQAAHFLNLLNNDSNELQDSSMLNPALIQLYNTLHNDTLHKTPQDSILKTELLFTGQFFLHAEKVYNGSNINTADLGWFIPRKKIDLTNLLGETLKLKASEIGLTADTNSPYKQLQTQLSFYYQLAKKEATDSIPFQLKPLKKGISAQVIKQIKNRLTELGDLPINDSLMKYDSLLYKAVVLFQKRMGLSVDGAIGNKMIEALNIPAAKRIKQLLINMERLRWLPVIKDSNYILVNIPEYKLHVIDSGKNIFDLNVIVGKTANGTVIFNSQLKYIVFSPYWNVPASIVEKEILPAIAKNPKYLEKNNMEITGKSKGLPTIRQKPGPLNSLGLVKFLFPNNYDIYLHDTPNRELFTQSSRGLSHGCIRISNPQKMAAYLLRNDTTWNAATIDTAMHQPKEKWVTLKKTIPVFIVYFTAWVDKNGLLNFRKDIYGHDEKMSLKLFKQ